MEHFIGLKRVNFIMRPFATFEKKKVIEDLASAEHCIIIEVVCCVLLVVLCGCLCRLLLD